MSRRTTAALILVLIGAAPSGAHATTTTVDRSGGTLTVEVTDEGTDLAPRNAIRVTEDATNTYVEDSGQATDTVIAAGNCFQVSAIKIGCPADPSNTTRLIVTPGEGDDTVSVDLPARSVSGIATIFVHGGPGKDSIVGSDGPDTLEGEGLDGLGHALPAPTPGSGPLSEDFIVGRGGADTIRGGPGRDYLNGGSGTTGADQANTLDGGTESDFFDVGTALGPDRVIGGPNEPPEQVRNIATGAGTFSVAGGDTVSYERRTFPAAGTAGVTVDIDTSADDGATGASEGDRIDPDVESIVGSVRDDRLVGTGNVERLEGGLGVDSLAGAGGADTLRFREGVRDRCYALTAGATVDLDLADPTPSDCQISIFPTTTKLTISPRDETMAPPVIGSALRRSGAKLSTTVRCDKDAPKACAGALALQAARGGRRLARSKFRVPAGGSRKVVLRGSAKQVRSLKTARLTTVGRGVSRRGNTTVIAIRRVR